MGVAVTREDGGGLLSDLCGGMKDGSNYSIEAYECAVMSTAKSDLGLIVLSWL